MTTKKTTTVAPSVPAPVKATSYAVAEGKSICTKKGLLAPNAVIKPEWVASEESFKALIAKGYIVEA